MPVNHQTAAVEAQAGRVVYSQLAGNGAGGGRWGGGMAGGSLGIEMSESVDWSQPGAFMARAEEACV